MNYQNELAGIRNFLPMSNISVRAFDWKYAFAPVMRQLPSKHDFAPTHN
jgi:hypothetical protein